MKSKQRVAIYNRTNHVNNTAALSYLEAYAKERGLDPIAFTDIKNGVGQGQALKDLLNLVRRNKIDIIITHSLSRFSREVSEVTAILNEVKKYNVQVVVLN